MSSDVEQAEQVSRGRAVAAPFIGLAMLSAQQWLFFGRDWDALSPWMPIAWLAMAIFVLTIVMTGGGWLLPRRLRPMIDDEVTRANRAHAIAIGFSAAMFVGLLVFAVSPFEPIDAQRAAHLIVSFGLGMALLTFGLRESLAHG